MFCDILKKHIVAYPKSQPCDLAKLCFQSEFGVNHFIDEYCLSYLEKEYDSISKNPDFPLFTEIGGGFIRVNLQPLKKSNLPSLAEAFIKTSENKCGNVEGLMNKLACVGNLLLENSALFSFSILEWEVFYAEYKKSGFPPVHHSNIYKSEYAPAYRVIKKEYAESFYAEK